MAKFKITANGKSFVITAPDQQSAMDAFNRYQQRQNPQPDTATTSATDPYFQGLDIPGVSPPGDTPQEPTRTFGLSQALNPNPLPAIAAFSDRMFGSIPIAGPYLQQQRDNLNAGIYGGTPEQARADIEKTVAANPEAAMAGTAAGTVAPYAAAAEVPLLAGALGFEGPLLSRGVMTGLSQYAINTGDNMAHGQPVEEASKNAVLPSAAAVPLSVFGRASRGETPRTEAVRTLHNYGVPVTGGQARGSRAMMMAESQFGGTAAQGFRDRQLGAFTKAALRTAGVNADRASPEIMDKAFDEIGSRFNSLASMTNVKVDQHVQNGLLNAVTGFQDIKGESRPILDNLLNRVGQLTQQGGGYLRGDSYKAISTELSSALKRANDPELIGALHDFKDALDDGVARSMNGQTLKAWQKTRQQYANLMKITNAVGGAGQFGAQGLITPEALSQAVRSGNRKAYVRGKGDLNELSRAGVVAMPAMPDSGTAGRLVPLISAQGGLAHLLQGGNPLVAAGLAGAGMAAPFVAGRAMLSGPGRAVLAKGSPVPAAVARGLSPLLINGPQP